jgi:hypothetical protein
VADARVKSTAPSVQVPTTHARTPGGGMDRESLRKLDDLLIGNGYAV